MTTEEIKKWVNTHLHQHWTFDIDQSFREIREQNREIIAIGDAYTVEYYEEGADEPFFIRERTGRDVLDHLRQCRKRQGKVYKTHTIIISLTHPVINI